MSDQMNDRTLLEMAAKAIGREIIGWGKDWDRDNGEVAHLESEVFGSGSYNEWNPLTDDGDALRLAVRLGLVLNLSPRQDGRGQTVVTYHGLSKIEEPCYDGEEVAARRAIVRAAAAMAGDAT